jgi:hypothetical protein
MSSEVEVLAHFDRVLVVALVVAVELALQVDVCAAGGGFLAELGPESNNRVDAALGAPPLGPEVLQEAGVTPSPPRRRGPGRPRRRPRRRLRPP